MSTDISKIVEVNDYTYDDIIKCKCHYEYQSTADCFSFHVNWTDSNGTEAHYDFMMSATIAHVLKEAIEAASDGKIGVYKSESNRFLK